jgi:hypothetical protein
VYGGHFREARHFRGQNSKNLGCDWVRTSVREDVGFGLDEALYTKETQSQPSDQRSTVENNRATWAGMGFSA